jgi:hypothetical protein
METKASDLDLLTRDLAGMSVDEEVHVEVTDADMNDHSLLVRRFCGFELPIIIDYDCRMSCTLLLVPNRQGQLHLRCL